MNPVIRLKQISTMFLVTLSLACFQLLHFAQAVVPPPDGGYTGFNTAEGQKALFSLSTGVANTAAGWYSLFSNTDGSFNTAVGAGTLLFNVGDQSSGEGTENTAVGAAALLFNTSGLFNTANGALALFRNSTGNRNTATGVDALRNNNADFNTANGESALASNTEGEGNIAVGGTALFSNTMGDFNTAIGYRALLRNTTGSLNTANGKDALFSNTIGVNNTASGLGALLSNTTGGNNTASGVNALHDNIEGDNNTALGVGAGFGITGSGNVCIGAGVNGFAGENNITRIRNVYESAATERAVYVTSDNRIGTLVSSRRYKDDIRPMEESSKTIHSLRPVRFRYKKEVDPTRSLCFGLIAEDVAKASPELVTLDREGRPQTVRYEAINAMLLNEFLKEHRKVESQESRIQQQEATIACQQKQIDALSAGLQKVTAHLEMREAAPQNGSE
jgi:trimeric autotransporter adhesin